MKKGSGSSLVMSLDRHFTLKKLRKGFSPSSCNRQVMGPGNLSIVVGQSNLRPLTERELISEGVLALSSNTPCVDYNDKCD